MNLLELYLLEINLVALILCTADKVRARAGKWRVPEGTLMLSAALGGSAGLLLGMLLLRHKTQHRKFTLGVPAMLTVHLILVYLVVNR